MTRVGCDVEICLRPGPMQIPSARNGADDVVAPLHNYPGNMPNPVHVLEQVVFTFEETVVHEVMAFDSCKRECECRISESFNRLGIKEKFRGRAFPNTPGARRLDPYLLISSGKSAIVCRHHVGPLVRRNNLYVFLPHIRKDPACALLIEPLDLLRPAQEDSPQYKFRRATGMRFGISQRERAAP